jgi:hypothetical protein
MSFTIIKTFTIKDPAHIPTDDPVTFVTNFYSLMITEGLIENAKISSDNFMGTMTSFKKPYYDSNKIIGNSMVKIDSNSYVWVGEFSSEETYNEYKAELMTVFNSEFNNSFDTTKISLVIG